MVTTFGRSVAASTITVDGTTVSVSASIGTVLMDAETADDREAFGLADRAMYEAKAARR